MLGMFSFFSVFLGYSLNIVVVLSGVSYLFCGVSLGWMVGSWASGTFVALLSLLQVVASHTATCPMPSVLHWLIFS